MSEIEKFRQKFLPPIPDGTNQRSKPILILSRAEADVVLMLIDELQVALKKLEAAEEVARAAREIYYLLGRLERRGGTQG